MRSIPLSFVAKSGEALVAKIGDKAAGQSALESLAKIAEEKGRPAEPFLVSAFPKILEAQNEGLGTTKVMQSTIQSIFFRRVTSENR